MIKVYSEYKTAKFKWLEKVPNHWVESRISYLFEIGRGRVISMFEINPEGIYPVYSSQTKDNGCMGFLDTFDFDDDILTWTTDGANAGTVFIRSGKFNCTNVCGTLKPKKSIDLKYYLYYLQYVTQFYKRPDTNGAKIMNNEMAAIYGLVPSIAEQSQIARYLDHQTSRIDEIINRKEKQIELLKEKRQATINEAVTKGINPNAKMRDSRIEWLGEIPEDWELRNLEVVAKDNRYSITGGPFGSDLKNEEYTEHGVRIIQLQNIGVGEFCDDYKIYTSEEKADYLFSSNIYPGEIIIAKMADPVARACIVPNTADRFIMASDGIRLEVDNDRFITKFIEYSINSKYFNYQAELNSTGTTRLRIGLTTLKKLKLLLPQLTEQVEIVEYLESYNKIFLEIFEKLSLQIQKLKEYRQSIISEAVTGKIDVRDWQPNNSSN